MDLSASLRQRLDASGLPDAGAWQIVKAFSGGRSNQSFLVQYQGLPKVLRFDAPDADNFGIDRAREARMQTTAAAVGIAPALLARYPKAGLTLFEYVPGQTLATMAHSISPETIVELLRRVHALPFTEPAFDYAAHLTQLGLDPQHEPQRTALQWLAAAQTRCVVHHDPIAANFVQTADGLRLLDWEYASVGFPALDWAAVVAESLVPAALVSDKELSPAALDAALTLYRSLCMAWERRQTAREG